MTRHQELTALRETDVALDLAMVSARENAIDLGLPEDTDECDAEIARQVDGWIANGREW